MHADLLREAWPWLQAEVVPQSIQPALPVLQHILVSHTDALTSDLTKAVLAGHLQTPNKLSDVVEGATSHLVPAHEPSNACSTCTALCSMANERHAACM